MNKILFTSITAMAMALYLLAACADESKDTENIEQTEPATVQEAVTEEAESTDVDGVSLLDQPVDFSTPENVEKTLQNIREQEGEKAYKNLKSAMQYVMFYDLSVGQSEEKLYKKLNGQTPNQIVAKMRR